MIEKNRDVLVWDQELLHCNCHVGGAVTELPATIESHCPLRRKAHLSTILEIGAGEGRKSKETLEISTIPSCLTKSRNVGKLSVSLLIVTTEGGIACMNLLIRGNRKTWKPMQR